MPFNSDRHHRRSIRLAGYDYTQPGAYFITICTHDRRPILAEITKTEHTLTRIGRLVARCWQALPRHFPNIVLDAWVIMPDHMHALVVIQSVDSHIHGIAATHTEYPHGTAPGSLPAIIQNFKSISTRAANKLMRTPGEPMWQRNYYERIVRDQAGLDLVRRYIEGNPAAWRPRE